MKNQRLIKHPLCNLTACWEHVGTIEQLNYTMQRSRRCSELSNVFMLLRNYLKVIVIDKNSVFVSKMS